MSLIRKHVAVLQAWACLALVNPRRRWGLHRGPCHRSLHKSQFTSQVLNSWFT